VLESAKFQIHGAKVEYDYKTNLGTIYQGSVQSGKVIFEGDKIQKTGENDFKTDVGKYTACDCLPRMWSFSGYDIDAEMGGYAKMKWPVLRILNIPVFALPYIIVPLKSDRQSGLLLPSHEFTQDGGTAFGGSMFWAVAQNKDATFTLKNYDRRGLKFLANSRYRLTDLSFAEFDGAFIDDRVFPSSLRLNDEDKGREINRWFTKYKHFLDLPQGYTHRANFTLLSDLQYLSDFSKELEEVGNPAIENRFALTKKSDSYFAGIEADLYTNLLKTNPLDNNDDAVHRLPEIKYSLVQSPIANSNFLFKLDAQYQNFARNGLAYDDITPCDPNPVTGDVGIGCDGLTVTRKKKPTPDGVFEPNGSVLNPNDRDIIRTGQRFDIQPSLSYIFFPADIFEVVPTISFRETHYEFGADNAGFSQQALRRYLQGLVSTRTTFDRIYEGKESRYKHQIIPEISWSNIPFIETPNHSFFGDTNNLPNFKRYQPLTDQDFFGKSGLQFDYFDRVLDKNLITLGVGSKLIRKRLNTNDPEYFQAGTLKVIQTYDLVEAAKKDTESNIRTWSEITTLLDLRFDNFETNSVFQYFPYHHTVNTSSRVKFFSNFGNYFQLSYTQKFTIPEVRSVVFSEREETVGTQLGLITKYFNLEGGLNYSFVGYNVESWGTGVTIKPPGNCVVFIFTLTQEQLQKPEITSKINFSFDGT